MADDRKKSGEKPSKDVSALNTKIPPDALPSDKAEPIPAKDAPKGFAERKKDDAQPTEPKK